MNEHTIVHFRVYQLDVYKNEEDLWSLNNRFELGSLSADLPEGKKIDDKFIIAALRGFEFKDIAGRSYNALLTTDRRRIYAEDPDGNGEWWEVGQKKGHRPVFGLEFFGASAEFEEDSDDES